MNYRKLYKQLIHNALNRKIQYANYEVHHIKPKCLGGSNDKNNLVNLTFREHYLAHRLLVKIYPNNKLLSKALWMMTITTIASLDNINSNIDNRLRKRIYSILENKKTKITTHEYDYAKQEYIKHMNGHKVNENTKKLISINTKERMLSKDVINKCASGSKGTRHYYDKITLKSYKWFPGQPEIDLTKFAYGRPPMSDAQKQKISKSNRLNKTKYHNDVLRISIEIYNDNICKVPNGWELNKKDYHNNMLFKKLISNIKQQLLNDNIFFNKIFTYNPTSISSKKRILNPAFFDLFNDYLINWKTDQNVTINIVNFIKNNLDLVLSKTKEYLKKEQI